MIKQRTKLILLSAYIIAVAVFLLARPVSVARSAAPFKPAFMDRYANDPYSKTELRGKCTVCHIGHGGGERNDFGDAFEDVGYRITPKLRAKFPDMFERTPRSDTP